MTQERQRILLHTRQRFQREKCGASLAITSQEQFLQYWAASESKLRNGPAANTKSDFTKSLETVNQFAHVLHNAVKPASGPDILWASMHAVIEVRRDTSSESESASESKANSSKAWKQA
jgi:hypothetical protein